MDEKRKPDGRFKTLKEREIKFGKNKFLQVRRTRFEDENNEKTNEFVAIASGFYTNSGEQKWKATVTFPTDIKVTNELIAAITEVTE